MLLLTGATGLVGSAVLRRLVAEGAQVRCLVRDPRRLGAQRVRVQIALGDLADPPSFRNAMRGVHTVVHLAASIRDQPRGSIEELNGIATWRMVEAAERSGVERFVFFSVLGASTHQRARAACARRRSPSRRCARHACARPCSPPRSSTPPETRGLRCSSAWRCSRLMPVSGRGRAVYQPIWAEDVADCVIASLRDAQTADASRALRARGPADAQLQRARAHGAALAGPQAAAPARPHADCLSRAAPAGGLAGTRAFATWDEAELMEVPMISTRGTADAESLGVTPQPMPAVLGTG